MSTSVAAGVASASAAAHAEDDIFGRRVNYAVQEPSHCRARVSCPAPAVAQRVSARAHARRGRAHRAVAAVSQVRCAPRSAKSPSSRPRPGSSLAACAGDSRAAAASASSDAAYMTQMRSALPISDSSYLRFMAAQRAGERVSDTVAKPGGCVAHAPASQRTCELASCSSSLLLPGLSAQARILRGRLPPGAPRRAANALNNARPATAAARPTRSAVLVAVRFEARPAIR